MKKCEILFLLIALCLSISSARADMNIPPDVLGNLSVYDSPGPTTVNVYTGGQVTGSLWAYDNTTVNLLGGSIGQSLNAYHNSLINVYHGSVGAILSTSNNAVANIYGGSIVGPIITRETSTVNIYGKNFNLPYGPVTATGGPLTGTLHKGDLINLEFARMDDRSTIYLHEMEIVPLPGAVILGGFGLITAGWRLRKRKTA